MCFKMHKRIKEKQSLSQTGCNRTGVRAGRMNGCSDKNKKNLFLLEGKERLLLLFVIFKVWASASRIAYKPV